MAEMGKRVGVAVDFSQCSKKALRWAIDNLLKKGDHLILITVRSEHNYESGEMQLWETTGSPLIPYNDFSNPNIMKKYKAVPDEETLKLVDNAAKEKEITALLKIFWGDPREKLCEAVNNIPLTCLVIGNRGLGPLKRVILGSVSNHVVNTATCPVTVVH
ncbi:universal stress protein PHOS32 [Silene latifolia]|uniref:universal stress protein PHOS32 n=1 Tax=Silene latifolia TaxID=37657 RepID=UPI003D788412